MTNTPPISFLAYRVEPTYPGDPIDNSVKVVTHDGKVVDRLMDKDAAEELCAELNAAYVKGFNAGRTSSDVLALVDAAKGVQDWANELGVDRRLIGRIDAALRPFMEHINRVRELIAKAENEPDLHNKGTDRLLDAIEKAEPEIPAGFEVREFHKRWYPCADFQPDGKFVVFFETCKLWALLHDCGWKGTFGYRTRSEALADMPRWIQAAKRESWYATMRRTAKPAPVVQPEPEPEQPERFDEMTGPMPDESGASGGYGFSEKSPRYEAAIGCGRWVVRDNRPGPQDPWEVAVGLGEDEARKMAELLNSGVVRTSHVTVPALVKALQDLRDIIHDDLSHARQRDHHEAIRAADVLLAAVKGGGK